jgi:hypothetical protein
MGRVARRQQGVRGGLTRVAGADRSERDVATFIVGRRRAGARSFPRGAGGVAFSIANAIPAAGAFWVHSVGARGQARIFAVREIFRLLAHALGDPLEYADAKANPVSA